MAYLTTHLSCLFQHVLQMHCCKARNVFVLLAEVRGSQEVSEL